MSYGAGWGLYWGAYWGGKLTSLTPEPPPPPPPPPPVPTTIDVVLGDSIGLLADVYLTGPLPAAVIIVAAQSPTKVEVVFSVDMRVDAEFLNPANYTITQVEGSIPISVLSVSPSGPAPIRRATLLLGTALDSKEYYFLTVSGSIANDTGTPSPALAKFQWQDMTLPLFRKALEIPISEFSEGGPFAAPEGMIFFTPAIDTVDAVSTIEVESVSACTMAWDEYHIPDIPDPVPLFTWGPGIASVTGPSSVLWATANRLGLARMDLTDRRADSLPSATDISTQAVLYETIDIIKGGGFMNDLRWATFPAAGGKTVFKTAANLSPIGPGPSTVIWSAGPGPIQDDIEIVDTASRQATYQKFLTDTFLSTDQLLVDRVFPQDTIGTSDQVTVNVDAPALQPLTIVTSVPVVFFFSGDVGVTTATGVSQWSDQSGNSRHLVQATGASQPTYNATALNGKGSLTFDGVDDVLGMSYVPPAPGTTPSWYWLIFRVIVHTSTMTVYGSTNTNRHRLFMTTASRLQVSNGVGGGLITEVAGTWYRNELSLTNSTNDYHKNGSTLTTGTNFGNNAGNIAMFLGAANSSFVLPGNIEVVCWGCWAGEPTSAEKTALNAWVTSYYGAAVQT